MMMDKRLLNVVPDSKKYIMRNVLCQWGALAANIVMMWNIKQPHELFIFQSGQKDT